MGAREARAGPAAQGSQVASWGRCVLAPAAPGVRVGRWKDGTLLLEVSVVRACRVGTSSRHDTSGKGADASQLRRGFREPSRQPSSRHGLWKTENKHYAAAYFLVAFCVGSPRIRTRGLWRSSRHMRESRTDPIKPDPTGSRA